ncbi:hypothetical protein LTR22_008216 [Elasticomyces elasticus]|nr:hypothetical protein LTR22_008216 [Elasticomyces elasticus]
MSSSFNTPSRRKPLFPAPSTTPAGPPPSHLSFTQVSTTPAGPPPKSSFFSSHNAANNTFGSRRGAAGATPARRGFVVPSSSPPAVDEEDEEDDDEMEVTEEKSAFMSSILSAPRGLKRSRNGAVREQVGSDYADIARSVTSHAPSTTGLNEPDEMLVQQETILSRLESSKNAGEASEALTKLWARYADPTTREGKLGPEAEDGLSKAVYLASLLLTLHHPHQQQQTSKQQPRKKNETTTLPRALLNWLDEHHTPFPDEFPTISTASPSPASHDRFWDTIYASLVRGRFTQAIQLLRHAGWENAYTAEEDSQPEGYTEKQLDNIEEVAERAARVLSTCPAVVGKGEGEGDWDTKGPAWTLFRLRVRQAVKELELFAGSAEEDDEEDVGSKRKNVFSLSAATKKAESKVPWSIYTNLKLCYDILLGQPEEIMDASQDWLEASIYITAWWDGEESSSTSSTLSRSQLGESRSGLRVGSQRTREVDLTPLSAYRRRLADAFTFVTDTEEPLFLPETVDEVHVGLGCVLTGGVESVVQLLRGWSLPVAVAVVEVAGTAGWLPGGRGGAGGRGWSSQDLMVLSHGPGGMEGMGSAGLRDAILGDYAELLAAKDFLVEGKSEKEGWELAVAVLGRLDDQAEGERRVGELLGGIEVRGEGRVERILEACGGLGLEGRGRGVAERFADSLLASDDTAEVMQNVGTALIYLSRARCGEKITETLGLLVSLCLIHSAAYPAQADLDQRLAGLVGKERTTLVELARKDGEAAELLAGRLSGYATLRRFYELRDQDVLSSSLPGAQRLRPLERAREAAGALMAVLGSAADCIRGGLYDPEAEGGVPVDCVLALLGEALVLLGQGKRVFSKEQVFGMMRIVEDFETVTSRVRENGGALLEASLGAYRDGGRGKSTFGGSSWDMLASSTMVHSAGGKEIAEREWDWRKGVDELGVEAGGKEVVAMVRVALAQEVARGWGGGLNW